MILAGDVGGTKSLLGVFEPRPDRPVPLVVREFTTLDFDSLEELAVSFLTDVGATTIRTACVGVAGPVSGDRARLTNVPWIADAGPLADRLRCPVRLVNDLVALATAVPLLEPHELHVLQEGSRDPDGNAAVIAAGTGLGEAILANAGGTFVPSASEGGHADFSPRSAAEAAYVEYLRGLHGRVDGERVVSGPGLVNAWGYTHRTPALRAGCRLLDGVADIEAPATVTRAAAERRCTACVGAMELFIGAYGSEAGNLALRAAATAGVYVGGGIAPKILPWLDDGAFLEAFCDKPPLADYLRTIPVAVVLNASAGLLGAAANASPDAARG